MDEFEEFSDEDEDEDAVEVMTESDEEAAAADEVRLEAWAGCSFRFLVRGL